MQDRIRQEELQLLRGTNQYSMSESKISIDRPSRPSGNFKVLSI